MKKHFKKITLVAVLLFSLAAVKGESEPAPAPEGGPGTYYDCIDYYDYWGYYLYTECGYYYY